MTVFTREFLAEFVILAAVCVGAWYMLVDGRSTELADLNAEIAQTGTASTDALDIAESQFLQESSRIRDVLYDVQARSELAADASDLYDSVVSYARLHDVKVDRLTPSVRKHNKSNKDSAAAADLSLNVSARYEDIASFLASLKQLGGFVRPTDLRITAISDEEGRCSALLDLEVLSFDLTETLAAAITGQEEVSDGDQP